MPSTSWSEFLKFITTAPGIQVVLGFVLARLAEVWPAFQDKPKEIKQFVFAGICMIVPVIGAVLGILTAGWEPTWEITFWPAIVAGFSAACTAFAAGTLANAGVKYAERSGR